MGPVAGMAGGGIASQKGSALVWRCLQTPVAGGVYTWARLAFTFPPFICRVQYAFASRQVGRFTGSPPYVQ